MGLAPSRKRFAILALISLGVMVNYLDRAIIGIASPAIARDFALSPVAMGLIFSAFSWSYFAAQIPGGLLLDRFGARLTYLVALAGWSRRVVVRSWNRGFRSGAWFRRRTLTPANRAPWTHARRPSWISRAARRTPRRSASSRRARKGTTKIERVHPSGATVTTRCRCCTRASAKEF